MANVSLNDITKKYDDVEVLPKLSLDINDQEFVVLVGPSGCGKTTTLRIIAGLESSSSGVVKIGGRDVTQLRPGLRNCSMVFQNYALYPHMTVRENISYGLKVRGVSRKEIDMQVDYAARTLGLSGLLDRKPGKLSGGQRQRVAIGRAIVRQPDVFLFDEPLSNLDAKLRIEMRAEIKDLHQRLKNTMIYVTHDQVEAMTLADRVVVMNNGAIEQVAAPLELYEHPVNQFVAGFIGSPTMNFLHGVLTGDGAELSVNIGSNNILPLPESVSKRYEKYVDRKVVLGIRPEHMQGGDHGRFHLKFRPRVIDTIGPYTHLNGELHGRPFTVQVDSHFSCSTERDNCITVDMSKAHLFDPVSGRTL